MKIALLAPSIYMSPTRYKDMIFAPRDLAVTLADGLVDRGHAVYFFTAPDIKTKATLMPADSDLLTVPYEDAMLKGRKSERLSWGFFYRKKQLFELSLTQACYAFATENDIDIVHSYIDFGAHFFHEATHVPTVYTLHDPLPEQKDDLTYWLLNRFAQHPYVSISNAFRKSQILNLNFAQTVYHGIPTPADIIESDASYIAFIGRLVKEKGAHTALDIAKTLQIPIKLASSRQKENITDDTYYSQEIAPRIDDALVSFTPFMSGTDKDKFYRHAKCLLVPIEWEEPFGMVMIEAMAQGTPVIAYNRGSVAEIVKDGVTGFVIDSDTVDRPGKGSWIIKKQGKAGLIEAMHRIGEINRKDCIDHVRTHFSVQQMVQGYEQVYQQFIR